MAKGKHIIHKLVLQIEVPQRAAANKVQDNAARHFEQVLVKQLEKLLDEMDVPGHVVIDKIDLDLGAGNKMEDVFEQLRISLFKVLDPVVNPSVLPDTEEEEAEIRHLLLTEEQKAFDVFVHFITTGRLPWYAVADTDWLQQEQLWVSKITSVLTRDGVLQSKLLRLFKTSAVAVNRLFKQFNMALVKKLVWVLFTVEEQQLQKITDAVVQEVKLLAADKVKGSDRQTKTVASEEESAASVQHQIANTYNADFDDSTLTGIVEKILLSLYLKTGGLPVISQERKRKLAVLVVELLNNSPHASISKTIEIAEVVLKQTESPSILKKDKPKATIDEAPEPDAIQREDKGGVYVSQAGLVILHPFLEYFFKDFGLLQDNDFVDLPARQLAIHLLHYLGTGNTNAFEYDLYFEKFLCRWPDEEPLEREVEIPRRMLDEGDNMLLTVIKYWKALKNTSPGGLREGFLNRNGKLIETEQPARLIVERMDMDILLATLPWGMGVIKLPWMVEPFYVEWQ